MNIIVDDIIECSKEPIRTPSAIQPFGYLLLISDSGQIEYVSENIFPFFGIEPSSLVGRSIYDFFKIRKSFFDSISTKTFMQYKCKNSKQYYYGYIIKINNFYGLEIYKSSFEKLTQEPKIEKFSVESVSSTLDLCHKIANYIFYLLGFERVMVYKFDHDYNGEVISESTNIPGSYMGHHFPADDIPAQARALYLENLVRIIPDATYVPVRIYPEPSISLDMTHSTLRSVSPVHCEYLANMSVRSSMSLSLVVDNRLWGLIACHSSQPKDIHPLLRNRIELELSQINQMLQKQLDNENELEEQKFRSAILDFEDLLERHNFLESDLLLEKLKELVHADGVTILNNDLVLQNGITPDKETLHEILRISGNREFFASSTLRAFLPLISNSIMGAVIVKINSDLAIIFTRQEMVKTLLWAGRPEKQQKLYNGVTYISPRQSFETYIEEEKNKSIQWTAIELVTCKALNGLSSKLLHALQK